MDRFLVPRRSLPGNVTVARGPAPLCAAASLASAAGGVITVNMTCAAKAQFTVTFSGVTAPTAAGPNTFTTKTKQSGGTPTSIGTSPVVTAVAATTTTVASSANPSVFGQSVTFTATV